MQTTRFRVWLCSSVQPVWTSVKLVGLPEYIDADAVDVTVKGNGSDLRRLIADRKDIFAAYLQFEPEEQPRASQASH